MNTNGFMNFKFMLIKIERLQAITRVIYWEKFTDIERELSDIILTDVAF